MTTQHVMVDLETQASSGDAVIIAFGAVAFNPQTGEIGATFSMNIDPQSCLDIGLVRSQETMDWWASQSQAAQDAWKENPVPIKDALAAFTEFVKKNCGPKAYFWGNGATFDNIIVRNAYTKAGMKAPWPYYTDMCYRTMKNVYPNIPMVREGVHHKALSDAISQAKHLIAIYAYKQLGEKTA